MTELHTDETRPSQVSTSRLVASGADDFLSASDNRKEKRKINKNIVIVSCGFLFLFTAFQSLQNLQSSLNPDEGLGLASLCVIYASLILSCIFVPPFLIGRLGCKWTLVLAMTGYVLYTVANYYANWYTLIPASIIIGGSSNAWGRIVGRRGNWGGRINDDGGRGGGEKRRAVFLPSTFSPLPPPPPSFLLSPHDLTLGLRGCAGVDRSS